MGRYAQIVKAGLKKVHRAARAATHKSGKKGGHKKKHHGKKHGKKKRGGDLLTVNGGDANVNGGSKHRRSKSGKFCVKKHGKRRGGGGLGSAIGQSLGGIADMFI